MSDLNEPSEIMFEFDQTKFLSYIERFNLTELDNKLLSGLGENHIRHQGICFGLSHLQMIYTKNNLGVELVKLYKKLNILLDMPLIPTDPLLFYKQKAIQSLSIAKLNQMTIMAIRLQENQLEEFFVHNINKYYITPKEIFIGNLKDTIDNIYNSNFRYFDEIGVSIYNITHKKLKTIIDNIYECIERKLSIESIEKIPPELRNLTIKLKEKFSDYFDSKIKKVTTEDAMKFIKSITSHIEKDTYNNNSLINQQYGISYIISTPNDKIKKLSSIPINIETNLYDYLKLIQLTKNNHHYTIILPKHAINISIEYDDKSKKSKYSIYDSNHFISIHSDFNKFKEKLKFLLNYYDREKNNDGKYNSSYLEDHFDYDNQNNLHLPEIKNQEILHLTHKYYADNKLNIRLGLTSYIIEYRSFDNKSGIIKLILKKDTITKEIYTNLLYSEKLYGYIEYHIEKFEK